MQPSVYSRVEYAEVDGVEYVVNRMLFKDGVFLYEDTYGQCEDPRTILARLDMDWKRHVVMVYGDVADAHIFEQFVESYCGLGWSCTYEIGIAIDYGIAKRLEVLSRQYFG